MIFCHPVYINYEPDVKNADAMPVKFTKLLSKLRATAYVHGENKLNSGGLFLSPKCSMNCTHLLGFQMVIAKFIPAECWYAVG